MPEVSVIIPVYNHEKFIAGCIESVLGQTYSDFEIVVVDDGSTDKTPDILKGFRYKIKYIRQENKGGAAALNTALRNSSGKYIAWLSSDDAFMPTKLEEQVSFLENNPDFDLVYTDFYIIDSRSSIISRQHSFYYPDKKEFLYRMLVANFINGSSAMFKRSCIEHAGYFDEKMRYHADGELWFRMLKYYSFGHIAKPLLKYRWHASNLSHHFRNMKKSYYMYYKKILEFYDVNDFFPEGVSLSDAYFRIAEILEKHRIYSMAFSYLRKCFKVNPGKLFSLGILFFLVRLPCQFIIDLGLMVFCWEQRHFQNTFLSKLFFKLNNKVAAADLDEQ